MPVSSVFYFHRSEKKVEITQLAPDVEADFLKFRNRSLTSEC